MKRLIHHLERQSALLRTCVPDCTHHIHLGVFQHENVRNVKSTIRERCNHSAERDARVLHVLH